MSRVHAKTVDLCESAPGFLSWLMEENSDFEEIRADDGQSSNGAAIRQNVPPKVVPQTNRQQPARHPWGAAYLDPTLNAALNPHRDNPASGNRRNLPPKHGEVAIGGILQLYCSMTLPDSHGKPEESI
jgi:hypothetical protein